MALAALLSAAARELRDDFERCALPVLILERSTPPSPLGARHPNTERSGHIGDTPLRDALRSRFFARVRHPNGRDLARLDFTETAHAVLDDLMGVIPPSQQPWADEMQAVAYALAVEFRLGEARLDPSRVAAILRQHTHVSAPTADELGPELADGLVSLREVACGRCRVRCVDLPAVPMTRAFFASGHPSLPERGETA